MNRDILKKVLLVLYIMFSVVLIAGINLFVSINNAFYLVIGIVGLVITIVGHVVIRSIEKNRNKK